MEWLWDKMTVLDVVLSIGCGSCWLMIWRQSAKYEGLLRGKDALIKEKDEQIEKEREKLEKLYETMIRELK